jgi:hypothetical protein
MDYDKNALRRAILILASKVRREMHLGIGPAEQLAAAAIQEIMHWQCRTCNGASEQIIGGVRKTCPKCGGLGVHWWSESDRAKAAGYPVETWPKWAPKYEKVLAMAQRADSSAVGQASKRMGYGCC